MIHAAVADLSFDHDDLVVTILREHEERFDATNGLAQAFGRPIRTCILEQQTQSQGDTIAQTLQALQLKEPFLIKDADGAFALETVTGDDNYICTDTLNNHELISPRSKSYVCMNDDGNVTAIREKFVISDTFNVGGYYFTSPSQFLKYYQRAVDDGAKQNEIYISNVIACMLRDGIPFRSRPVSGFRDWGTLREWRRALAPQRTYLVQFDGFLFERGNRYFKPRFNEVRPQAAAVAAVRMLAAEGRKIVYLSIRPAETAELTARQLREADLPPGPIVFDCTASQWQLVTAPQETLPFKSGGAIELAPDHTELASLLQRIPDGD